jgi:hypothetical protein
MTEQRYFAGGQEFRYPHAGDPHPPNSTKVLLLSKGGICTVGYWGTTWCIGWLPLPKRNMDKEDKR